MNKLSLAILMSTVSLTSYAADDSDNDILPYFNVPQYRLGELDRLVLKKVIAEKGWETLKVEIEHHQFRTNRMVNEPNGIERGFKIDTPYTISQLCIKDDGSDISKRVFGWGINKYQLQMGGPYFMYNSLNERHQKVNDRVDYCTSATLVDGTSIDQNSFFTTEVIQITTMFFDKQNLLVALEELKP